MAGRQLPWRKSVILAVVLMFGISLFAPIASYADTNLVVGGTARVAYSNGEDVRLRSSAGKDAEVVAMVPEGAVLDVLDGPIVLEDGSYWYQLQWGELSGFIVSDFLALDTGDAAPAEEVVQGPAVGVVGFAWVLNSNGEGVRCRVAPDANSALITVIPEGSEVSLTGLAEGEWQPVLCADTPGYVHIAFVSYDGSLPPGNSYWAAPVVEEPVVEEAPVDAPVVDEPVVEEAPPVEEPVTEEPAPVVEETPAVELPVEEPATEEPAQATEEPATEAPAEEPAQGSDGAAETPAAETPAADDEVSLPAEDDAAETPEVELPVELDPSATVVGYGIITGTNGDGIRCRIDDSYEAAVITILPEGVTVEIRGAEAAESWTPVFCGGKEGFVVSTFVAETGKPGTEVAGADAEGVGKNEFQLAAISGNVQVSGTGGGLNCRSSDNMTGSVITVVSDGSKLTVRGDVSGDWLPVVCANRNGWVYASYTKATGTSTSDTAGPVAEGTGGTSTVTGTAKVNASGDGLRCRQNPNYDGKIITVLSDGSSVSLRGDQRGDWQPVFCGGQKGHVFAQYLSNRSTSTSGGSTSGGSGSASFSSGSLAVVTGTGGSGVRLRAAKSTSSAIVTVVGEGKTVQVTSGSSATWIAVSYNGSNGFISADYLKPTTNTGTSPGSGTDSGSTTSFRLQIGDKAVTLASVNLRYGSSLSSGVAAVVPAGTVIKITGSPKDGFYPSNWDGLKGYIYTDFLRETDQPVSIRGGSGTVTPTPTPTPAPGGGGGSASGQAIVNFAMQYVGYPYVWATHGPGSFDCSGFTSWVIKNVLGLSIGYSVPPQFNFGVGVSRANLQPGDVVFFENTYTFGLSHVGIYIGNNQFVHAENPSTGVRVSDLNSNYYSTRFYGARRMG